MYRLAWAASGQGTVPRDALRPGAPRTRRRPREPPAVTPRALPSNGERRSGERGRRRLRGSGPAAAPAARIPHVSRPGRASGTGDPGRGRWRLPRPGPEAPRPLLPAVSRPATVRPRRGAMTAESVKVVVRCRPMNRRERELNCQCVVTVDSARGQCFIQNPGAAHEPPKQFTFDGAYYMEHFTEQIYNEIAYPLVEVRAPGRPPPRTGWAGLGAPWGGPERTARPTSWAGRPPWKGSGGQ